MINLYGQNLTVFNGSGALSFYGDGYWYSKLLKKFGLLNYDGITFVSKTSPNEPREGNTHFVYDGDEFPPVEINPRSIVRDWFKTAALNCVGLYTPGFDTLLKTGKWQKRNDVYVISWMALSDNKIDEALKARNLFISYKSELGKFIIEVNISCPNTGENQLKLIEEAERIIVILSEVGVPIFVKISIAAAPIDFMMRLNNNHNVTAITCSNTVPYGWQGTENFYRGLESINWNGMFGFSIFNLFKSGDKTKMSPLEKKFGPLGKGGLSGKPIKPYVIEFIKNLRDEGFRKPIIGGGGIMSSSDVWDFHGAGANACFVTSAFFFRFWQIKKIIKTAKIAFA